MRTIQDFFHMMVSRFAGPQSSGMKPLLSNALRDSARGVARTQGGEQVKMQCGLTTEVLSQGIRSIALRVQTQADELNALDGKLGDGDLGVTMGRGFAHMVEALPSLPGDLGQAFLSCAQAFTLESGSSFGTLLASALISAAKQTKGRTQVPWSEISALLMTAFNAMAARGKASLGDKTVLDVLHAAAEATAGLDEPAALLQAAVRATDETITRMRNQPARIGRARIFGERSIGLDDPGMSAFRLMLQALGGIHTISRPPSD
jgi:phosphoenolpyruvate---glycerone phosphotransferase subunit DhaL